MENKLYTLPNCERCKEVKNYLKSKKIDFQEINAGVGEGRKSFTDFFSKYKDKIQRDGENGPIVLPILHSGEEVLQGLEKIIKYFN